MQKPGERGSIATWKFFGSSGNIFILSGFFQTISHFLDGFKTIRIFSDHLPFSGQFHNCLDFSRSFPIFQTVSKPSAFFRIISYFPDSVTTVWIFPDHFPFSRRFQKPSGLPCTVVSCIVLSCIVLTCISLSFILLKYAYFGHS